MPKHTVNGHCGVTSIFGLLAQHIESPAADPVATWHNITYYSFIK